MIWYVYILHFRKKFYHCQHYIGIAINPKNRKIRHNSGNGSRLVRAVVKAGIKMTMKTLSTHDGYTAAHIEEKRLKSFKKSKTFCPICKKRRRL